VTSRCRGRHRRLLTGALTVLRAEGYERVHARVEPDGARAALLAAAGFTADGDPARANDRARFLLLL
jgi:uncharacterized membrane-anchored protein